MPETTENFHRIPNPNYSGQAFEDKTRTRAISEDQGVSALWSPLKSSAVWKVRTFLFAREKWDSIEAAQGWVEEHKATFAEFGVPLHSVQCFEVAFDGGGEGSADDTIPTEDEYTVIAKFAPGAALDREDYYVRRMRLTNDQWSRSNYVRLSRGFQRSLIDDAPGKSLLIGHASFRGFPAEPEGMFFDGYERRDDDSGVTWGMTKFFMPRTSQNDHARKMIDSGAWKYVSVGLVHDWTECSICGENVFGDECKHIPAQSYPKDELVDKDRDCPVDPRDPEKVICGMICRGTGSMLEGSIVYLPELRGTEIVMDAQTALHTALQTGNFGEAKRLMLSGEGDGSSSDTDGAQATAAEAAALGATDGGAAGTTGAKTGGTNDMELEKKVEELQATVTAREATIVELTSQAETKAAETKALEAKGAEEGALRAAVVAEVARLAGLVARTAELDAFKAAFGDDLAAMPADKLLALQTQWSEAFDAATPPGGKRQSTGSELDSATGEPPPGEEPEETADVERAHIL